MPNEWACNDDSRGFTCYRISALLSGSSCMSDLPVVKSSNMYIKVSGAQGDSGGMKTQHLSHFLGDSDKGWDGEDMTETREGGEKVCKEKESREGLRKQQTWRGREQVLLGKS